MQIFQLKLLFSLSKNPEGVQFPLLRVKPAAKSYFYEMSTSSQIHTVCVCGAGTMGAGIAQLCAQKGFTTFLFDINKEALEKAAHTIEKNLSQLVSRNKITEEAKGLILQHLNYVSDTNHCIADIIIEAIAEKKEWKIALFNQLAEVNHSETIFVSNTSSLSVTEIAKGVQHPERVAGLHFFNPATILPLVEVITTSLLDQTITPRLLSFAKELGKTPVICKDAPGFIVNHVARPYYLEALHLLEKGWGDIATIDQLLEASGFKMGPFKLMDLIGNDINYAVSCSVFDQLGQPARLEPSPIQAQKVKEGALGKKAGKGYYEYPSSL